MFCLVRLGRYPAGTLVENETNKNSGTRPQIEQTTAWYTATNLGCVSTPRVMDGAGPGPRSAGA